MNYAKQFYQACLEGKVDQVRDCAKHAIDVSQFIDTAFSESASRGHLEILKFLVNNFQIDIHANEERALVWACMGQHYSTVEFLLSQGADITSNNYEPFTILVENSRNTEIYARLLNTIFPKLRMDIAENEILKTHILTWGTKFPSVLGQILQDNFSNLSPVHKMLLIEGSIANDNVDLMNKFQNDSLFLENRMELLALSIKCESNTIIHHFIENFSLTYSEASLILETAPFPLAFTLLNKFPFENYAKKTSYDNYNQANSEEFCIPESYLPRFYQPIIFSNDKEAFANLLLDRISYVGENTDIAIFHDLIRDREQYGIKDQYIVQYIVEGNYNFVDCEDEIDLDKVEIFKKMLDILIAQKVSLHSDTNGYLVQIACRNEIGIILNELNAHGSNVNGFLLRYDAPNNWLENGLDQELEYEYDYNAVSDYDIYKKFDSRNKIGFPMIALCKALNGYNDLKSIIIGNS